MNKADERLSEANMDSIIGGIEEIYRDNSRNGMCPSLFQRFNANIRCDDNHHGSGLTSNLVKSEPPRLFRLAIRRLCRCSTPDHRCRVW